MKYIDISTVVNSYEGFQNSMTNKSWGYLALLKGCNNYIIPSVSYEVDMNVVSNFLEGIFNLSSTKRQYNGGRSLFVVFSNIWENYFNAQGQYSPNIYDIAAWAYRRKSFKDNITENDLIKQFTEEFHIPFSIIEKCFDTKRKDIIFSNSLYSESDLKSSLRRIGVDVSRDNIDAKKGSVVASPGEISRGPFVQTLYAGLDITEYVLILQSNYDSLYGSGAEKRSAKLDSFPFRQSIQQIFYGAPGTGKSFAIKNETEGRAVIRTTFHPDSDYSTFVGAYKPTSIEVPVMTIIGKEQVPVENAKPEKKIVYDFVPQAFLKAYTGAWKNQDEPFFLVIEEINRGNCAQIFGDLFQLLDRNDETGLSDYPISPDEDIQKFLLTDRKFGFAELTEEQKAVIPEEVQSGELLILPKNLHIWATMNTSDQSLFPIDSAFKRRWDWQYIPISNGNKGWQIEVKDARYDWWDFLSKMNEKISSTTHSEDKKLGYYFCKTRKGIIDAKTFVGKVIFYVWNDVFKDFAEEAGDLFKDENGDLLSYDKFYGVGADGNTKVLEDRVALFLEHLGVEPVGETNPDDVEEDEEEDAEDAGGVRRGVAHRQLISVSFPDGTKFDISDGLTHFTVYLEAIKKIGLERAEPIAAASKYHRLNRPVISKERFPEIEADRYSYEQVGEYFLIKGMSNDTYINILNLCNEQLNLGISVEYRE